MNASTATPRNLQIDGMNGDACVKKVSDALKNVSGVTQANVQLGAATITADDEGCKSACAAIGTAGFKTREDKRHHDASPAANASTAAHTSPAARNDHRPAHQTPATPAPQPVVAAKPVVAAH